MDEELHKCRMTSNKSRGAFYVASSKSKGASEPIYKNGEPFCGTILMSPLTSHHLKGRFYLVIGMGACATMLKYHGIC